METATLRVQVLLAGIEPPAKLTDAAAATGTKTPPQVLVETTSEATVMAPGATGNVSLNATAVITAGVPLVRVKLSTLFWPNCTGVGLKTLSI